MGSSFTCLQMITTKDRTFSFQLRYPRDLEIIAWLESFGTRHASQAVREVLLTAAKDWLSEERTGERSGKRLPSLSQKSASQESPEESAKDNHDQAAFAVFAKLDKEFD